MHLVNHDVDRTVSEVASLEENKKCFECGGQSLWASVSLGVFLCLTHAGEHRHLGTHLSTVRSLTLDRWSPEQVKFMELGGNARARAVFGNTIYDTLAAKYSCPNAYQYREQLEKEVNLALGITQDKNNYIQLDPSLERFANAKSFGSSDFRQNRDPDVKEYSPKFDIFRCCTLF